MISRVFIPFFFILYFLSNIYALSVDIDGELKEYSDVYTETISLSLLCIENFSLQVPSLAKDISFNEVSTKNTSFFVPACTNSTNLTYSLEVVEKVSDKRFRLERNFNTYTTSNYTYTLEIPLTYELDQENSFPKPVKIIYEESKQSLVFNEAAVFVLYFDELNLEENSLSFSHLLEELQEFGVLILLFLSCILGSGITYIFMKRQMRIIPQEQVPSYILSKEEKLVLDVIKEHKGINQKQIAIKLNFSKSRISALVTDLEQKQLIRREKFGRSFKVYLNKKIV